MVCDNFWSYRRFIFHEAILNQYVYLHTIQTLVKQILYTSEPVNRNELFYHQCGCPADTRVLVRQVSDHRFTVRWIGGLGPINCPLKSLESHHWTFIFGVSLTKSSFEWTSPWYWSIKIENTGSIKCTECAAHHLYVK